MSYLVLARKWRPQLFAEVIGQEHVTRTLANAITSGRVAHAFLFSGPRGCGKTTTARLLAKALNCEKGPAPEPCNKCASCAEITGGSSMDVQEIDGASNTGVESVRDLRESAAYMPGKARFKIYIIDEVHMLSKNAFNALLKTLEEPPPHVKFVFATTEPHKIPLTILSRCQRYDFKRVPRAGLVAHLEKILKSEKIKHTPGALTLIAGQAGGSVRDALSLLEQVIAYAGESLDDDRTVAALGLIDRRTVTGILRAVAARDREACTALIDKAYTYGFDMQVLAEELMIGFRNLLVLKTGGEAGLCELVTPDEVVELKPIVDLMSAPAIHRAFDVVSHAVEQVARSQYPKIVIEMAMMKLMVLEPLRPLDELIARISDLEGRLTGPAPARQAATGGPGAPGAPEERDRPQTGSAERTPPLPKAAARTAAPPPVEALEQPVHWMAIIDAVRRGFPPMAAQLEHGRFLSLEDEVLEIAFDSGSTYLDYMREEANLARLAAILEKHFSRKVRAVVHESSGGRTVKSVVEERDRRATDDERKQRDEAVAHPIVQEAVKVFGGRVIHSSKDKK